MRIKPAFLDGSRAVWALLLGVIPFGLVFGVVAAESVVGPVLGYLTSIVIFAGAAQFATVGLLVEGASAAVIIATALVINSRHLMYSAALSPAFREFPAWARYALPYVLTDQAFAVSIVRYRDADDPGYRWRFFAGAALTLWVSWQAATLIGVVVGARLPEALGLTFAIPLVFLALLVLTVHTRPELVAAIVGGIVAVAAAGVPYNLGLLIGACGGVVAGVVAYRLAHLGVS